MAGRPGRGLGVGALIASDPRHEGVEYLWRGELPERQFAGWHMGSGSSEPGTLFDWINERGVQAGDSAFRRRPAGLHARRRGSGAGLGLAPKPAAC